MLQQINEGLLPVSREYNVEFIYPRVIYSSNIAEVSLQEVVNETDIFLLLVSNNYIQTLDKVNSTLQAIMEKASAGKAKVIPVILEECPWQQLPFGSYLSLPKHGKAVNAFSEFKSALTEIVSAVKSILEVLNNEKALAAFQNAKNKDKLFIDLSGCNLNSIPFEMLSIKELLKLDLSNNNISTIENLETLTGLEVLNLSDNRIDSIQNLSTMVSLQRLSLKGNKIAEIKNLESLDKLTMLDLWKNDINIIKGLENNKQLVYLGLSENKIENIQNISHLSKLKNLYLGHNSISDLSELKNMTWLKRIVLTNNKVTSLKPLQQHIQKGLEVCFKYSFNEDEEGVFVKENPLSDPPEEVIIHGRAAVLKHFEDTVTHGRKKLEYLKFILVGNSKVGKSNFSEFLRTGRITENNASTHILDIQKWDADFLVSEEGTLTKLHLFDFGGQDYYHDCHQMYYSHDTAYILLWDTMSNKYEELNEPIDGKGDTILYDNYPLSYWLESINYNLKGKYLEIYRLGEDGNNLNADKLPPILIIQNKIDLGQGLLNQVKLSKQYPNIWGYFGVSLLKRKRTEILRELLSDYLYALNLAGRILSSFQIKIIKYFAGNEDDLMIYNINEFMLKCIEIIDDASVEFRETDAKVMAHILNNTGIMFFDSSNANNPVLHTNIKFLNDEIKLTMDIAKRGNEKGVFTTKEITANAQIKNHEKILELLTKNNSIIKLNETQYLAPQFLPTEPDPSVKFFLDTFTHTQLRYVYVAYFHKSLLLNLFARYINSQGKEQIFNIKSNPFWRNGIIISRGEGNNIEKVLVEFVKNEQEGIINIKTMKPFSRNGLEKEIENTIDELNRGWTFDKEISSDSKVYFTIKDLQLKSKQREFEFYEQGKKYRINDFKNILYFENRPSRLFISYSSKDKVYLSQFTDQLLSLRIEGWVETWDDRELQAGDKWDYVIKEQLEKSDYIILLISANFLNSEYIREIELKEALENSQKRVIPVIVDYCSWLFDEKLNDIQVLNKDAPLTSYTPISRGWLQVIEGIRNILKNK